MKTALTNRNSNNWIALFFQFQISRRPRELFKSSSVGVDKTGDVAPSNVKLQVLWDENFLKAWNLMMKQTKWLVTCFTQQEAICSARYTSLQENALDIALCKKTALPSQPVRCKIKTRSDFLVFPALSAGDKRFLLLMVCIYCDWPLCIYFVSYFFTLVWKPLCLKTMNFFI